MNKKMNTLKQLVTNLANNENSFSMDLFQNLLQKNTNIRELKTLVILAFNQSLDSDEIIIPMAKRILELNPRDLEAIIVLGWILWIQGDDDECFSLLERAKQIEPNNTLVMIFEAALIYDDVPRQIYLYERVLQKDPTNRIALHNLETLKRSEKNNLPVSLFYGEFPSDIRW